LCPFSLFKYNLFFLPISVNYIFIGSYAILSISIRRYAIKYNKLFRAIIPNCLCFEIYIVTAQFTVFDLIGVGAGKIVRGKDFCPNYPKHARKFLGPLFVRIFSHEDLVSAG